MQDAEAQHQRLLQVRATLESSLKRKVNALFIDREKNAWASDGASPLIVLSNIKIRFASVHPVEHDLLNCLEYNLSQQQLLNIAPTT